MDKVDKIDTVSYTKLFNKLFMYCRCSRHECNFSGDKERPNTGKNLFFILFSFREQ